jgi:hypothetical protein
MAFPKQCDPAPPATSLLEKLSHLRAEQPNLASSYQDFLKSYDQYRRAREEPQEAGFEPKRGSITELVGRSWK